MRCLEVAGICLVCCISARATPAEVKLLADNYRHDLVFIFMGVMVSGLYMSSCLLGCFCFSSTCFLIVSTPGTTLSSHGFYWRSYAFLRSVKRRATMKFVFPSAKSVEHSCVILEQRVGATHVIAVGLVWHAIYMSQDTTQPPFTSGLWEFLLVSLLS